MAKELDNLLQQIERLRQDLHALIADKSLTDPEVVSASQMLDAVLNEYERFLSKRNKSEG